MITIRASGELSRAATNVMSKALKATGLEVCYWTDCTPKDRKPFADARKQKADVLILQMKKPRKGR